MITVNFDLNPAALRAIARCVNAHHECEAVDLEDHAAAVRVLEQVVGVGAITLNLDPAVPASPIPQPPNK